MSNSDIAIPPADDDLVFICGALRSGTTLLRLMVNHHPELENPGEMDFLFEKPPLRDDVPDMEFYAREISFNRVFRSTGLVIDHALPFSDLIRSFVRQLRKPGRRLSINVHRNFHLIPEIFPNARYVHLLRDPRDVAKSSIGMGWAGNVYYGVDHWISSERDFERLAQSVPPQAVYTMKNEALILSPEEELKGLCGFMGVRYQVAMLDYPTHTTYAAPNPSLIEQWKRDLSACEIALIEAKAGAMLAARGYELSGAPVVQPGTLSRFCLRQQNRVARIGFACRRFGLALTILDIVSRRLPVPALRNFTRRRLDKKALLHLK